MKFDDTLIQAVTFDLKTGTVPALMGEPGIGKSSFFEALAASLGTKCFTVAINEIGDKADLTAGRLLPILDDAGAPTGDYGQKFFPMLTIMEAIRYADENPRENPILFLDEINRAGSDITSAALSLPTRRMIGSMHLPKNLRIAIAGNDKGNVVSLDTASISRFAIYYVEPEAQKLIAILGNTINPWIHAVLVKHPALVFQKARPNVFAVEGDDDEDGASVTVDELFDAGEEMAQFTTPRTIEYLSHWLNAVNDDDPSKFQEWLSLASTIGGRETTVLNELLEAHTGNTEFTEKVVAEIANSLAQGMNSPSSSLSLTKPDVYDALKGVRTIDELEEEIAKLTQREMSACLLYAIYEQQDNERIIVHLATMTTAMLPEQIQQLVPLVAQQQVDRENLEKLRATGTPVGNQINMLATNLGI